MVIEYFSAQAAEDYPGHDATFADIEKHLWMTRFQVSLAVERQVGEWWWTSLINTQMELQSFDRDPAGYMYEQGQDDIYKTRTTMRWHLQNQVSWSIDNAWNNSGA